MSDSKKHDLDKSSEFSRNKNRKISFTKEQTIEIALKESAPEVREYVRWLKMEKDKLVVKVGELEEQL